MSGMMTDLDAPKNPPLGRHALPALGETRQNVYGSLEYHVPSTDTWVPAVRMNDIRAQLIHEASIDQYGSRQTYTYTKASSTRDPSNETAFFLPDRDWGEDRQHRPSILFQLRPTDNQRRELPQGVMRYRGYVVLDPYDHPVRNFPNDLPATISTSVHGSDVERWLRQNLEIKVYDIMARCMKGHHDKKGVWHDGPPRTQTVTENARKFRCRAGLIAWNPKDGSDTLEEYILSKLPPGATDNRALPRDFDNVEIKEMEEKNRGSRPNKARKANRAQGAGGMSDDGLQPSDSTQYGTFTGNNGYDGPFQSQASNHETGNFTQAQAGYTGNLAQPQSGYNNFPSHQMGNQMQSRRSNAVQDWSRPSRNPHEPIFGPMLDNYHRNAAVENRSTLPGGRKRDLGQYMADAEPETNQEQPKRQRMDACSAGLFNSSRQNPRRIRSVNTPFKQRQNASIGSYAPSPTVVDVEELDGSQLPLNAPFQKETYTPRHDESVQSGHETRPSSSSHSILKRKRDDFGDDDTLLPSSASGDQPARKVSRKSLGSPKASTAQPRSRPSNRNDTNDHDGKAHYAAVLARFLQTFNSDERKIIFAAKEALDAQRAKVSSASAFRGASTHKYAHDARNDVKGKARAESSATQQGPVYATTSRIPSLNTATSAPSVRPSSKSGNPAPRPPGIPQNALYISLDTPPSSPNALGQSSPLARYPIAPATGMVVPEGSGPAGGAEHASLSSNAAPYDPTLDFSHAFDGNNNQSNPSYYLLFSEQHQNTQRNSSSASVRDPGTQVFSSNEAPFSNLDNYTDRGDPQLCNTQQASDQDFLSATRDSPGNEPNPFDEFTNQDIGSFSPLSAYNFDSFDPEAPPFLPPWDDFEDQNPESQTQAPQQPEEPELVLEKSSGSQSVSQNDAQHLPPPGVSGEEAQSSELSNIGRQSPVNGESTKRLASTEENRQNAGPSNTAATQADESAISDDSARFFDEIPPELKQILADDIAETERLVEDFLNGQPER